VPRPRRSLAAVPLCAALALAGCGGDDSSSSGSKPAPPSSVVTRMTGAFSTLQRYCFLKRAGTDDPAAAQDAAQVLSVAATDYGTTEFTLPGGTKTSAAQLARVAANSTRSCDAQMSQRLKLAAEGK
jgi:hypothetical protein